MTMYYFDENQTERFRERSKVDFCFSTAKVTMEIITCVQDADWSVESVRVSAFFCVLFSHSRSVDESISFIVFCISFATNKHLVFANYSFWTHRAFIVGKLLEFSREKSG